MSDFYTNKLDKNINFELVIIHKNKHDFILKIINLIIIFDIKKSLILFVKYFLKLDL